MKCVVTNEPIASCIHCLDPDYVENDVSDIEYETIGPAFRTQFRATCTIESRHAIRKGDLVSKVQRADNPSILITGVVCKNCTIMLPRGKTR